MPYTKEIYEKAQSIIDARRAEAEKTADERKQLFNRLEPSYAELRREMINSVKEAVKAIDMTPEDAPAFLEKQKLRNLTAQQMIKELLKKHGLAQDFLEVRYSCPICSDTGINGTRLCECYIEVIKKLAFDEAGKKSPLKFCKFDDFRLDYYSDTFLPEYGSSPRERMSGIFDFCKEYAHTFDINSPSLFLYGQTGLGKTHLSLSIAGEVITKGYNVIYNSAQNIFNSLQKERFGKNDGEIGFEAMVLECDLLVIDDLGAEFSTQFTNAALYNIINTRINSGLPTIISTNLDLKGIEDRYTGRISSRIIGEYTSLWFAGEDIRQLKNS